MLRAREVHARRTHSPHRKPKPIMDIPANASACARRLAVASAFVLCPTTRQRQAAVRHLSHKSTKWRAWRRGHARSCSAWLDRRHAPCALSCLPVPSATRPPSGFALAHGARPHASHAPCSRREPPLHTGGGAGLCCAAARRHNLQVGEQRTLPLADAVPSAARAREDGRPVEHAQPRIFAFTQAQA